MRMRTPFMVGLLLVGACSCGSSNECATVDDCSSGEICVDNACVPGSTDTGMVDSGMEDTGSGDTGDTGTVDSGPAPSGETVIMSISGGGQASSPRLQMWGAIGGPQPSGPASSPRYRLIAGEGALPE